MSDNVILNVEIFDTEEGLKFEAAYDESRIGVLCYIISKLCVGNHEFEKKLNICLKNIEENRDDFLEENKHLLETTLLSNMGIKTNK